MFHSVAVTAYVICASVSQLDVGTTITAPKHIVIGMQADNSSVVDWGALTNPSTGLAN